MSTPRVSVLMATRNGEATLAEALASLAAQRYPDVEVIAVDDGSTDGSTALLQRFAAAQPRVTVLRGGGKGLAAALNLAAQHATPGALLARHDDDDRSHPDRFARQVEFLAVNPGVSVLGTATRYIGAGGEPRGEAPLPHDDVAIRRALRRGPPFVHGSVMMRPEVFHAAGGYRAAFGAAQDFDLWLRLPPGAGLANLREPLYEWRWHARGTFMRDRASQLRFSALARAFAYERHRFGTDSYPVFEREPDFDAFLRGYRCADRLALLLGEVYVRERLPREARRWLAPALASPRTRAAAAWWWALSLAAGLAVPTRNSERSAS